MNFSLDNLLTYEEFKMAAKDYQMGLQELYKVFSQWLRTPRSYNMFCL